MAVIFLEATEFAEFHVDNIVSRYLLPCPIQFSYQNYQKAVDSLGEFVTPERIGDEIMRMYKKRTGEPYIDKELQIRRKCVEAFGAELSKVLETHKN